LIFHETAEKTAMEIGTYFFAAPCEKPLCDKTE